MAGAVHVVEHGLHVDRSEIVVVVPDDDATAPDQRAGQGAVVLDRLAAVVAVDEGHVT